MPATRSLPVPATKCTPFSRATALHGTLPPRRGRVTDSHLPIPPSAALRTFSPSPGSWVENLSKYGCNFPPWPPPTAYSPPQSSCIRLMLSRALLRLPASTYRRQCTLCSFSAATLNPWMFLKCTLPSASPSFWNNLSQDQHSPPSLWLRNVGGSSMCLPPQLQLSLYLSCFSPNSLLCEQTTDLTHSTLFSSH